MIKYAVKDLLPHRAPMILITEVEEVNLQEQTLIARVDVTSDDILYQENIHGIPSCVALEYMSQAIGCFVGYYDLESQTGTPSVGFVIGSRKLEIFNSVYEVNQSYFIHIKSEFIDENIASFDCIIYDNHKNVMASAIINVFRPDDIKQFIEERHE